MGTPTEFPTWVSPAVSGGVVYTGHITNIGKPYKFDVFGTPVKTPLFLTELSWLWTKIPVKHCGNSE